MTLVSQSVHAKSFSDSLETLFGARMTAPRVRQATVMIITQLRSETSRVSQAPYLSPFIYNITPISTPNPPARTGPPPKPVYPSRAVQGMKGSGRRKLCPVSQRGRR